MSLIDVMNAIAAVLGIVVVLFLLHALIHPEKF
ncbi:MAG: potassium-transporting ATPase subunit F [Cutibacterium granulosum]|nr:potassium-transporting ATPase subunit F [Cutibacterium granulosum]MEA5648766.1 potassium-transporting ATPase subunit F [Cutibacterium granulosum]MEA5653608.1 potassium-transporting ATPase subunit F [Cutibacterium granulosum]MEA5663376.1 potassium-transporting ATPase subunit F [Cutibacterium granulosum]MEA5664136.1 potassium-transporting ATPase subunit F [Cutibacterium granulosum]